MQKGQIRFSLVICRLETKSEVEFKVYSVNKDVPDEILITMVKNWLKTMEDIYHKNFPSKYLV
jgi:hypothetical protein